MGIFAELLCGTGGQTMMKLAYERPVMRAEAFATNAYCNGCKKQASFTGILTGILNDITYLFDSASRRDMINQDTGLKQYYYTGKSNVENDENVYFLEYCASAEKGKDFFVYQDLGEKSGYCQEFGGPISGGLHDLWGDHNCDGKGKDTLQVAQGPGQSGRMYSDKTYMCWYADLNLGNITYEHQIAYTQS